MKNFDFYPHYSYSFHFSGYTYHSWFANEILIKETGAIHAVKDK